MTVFIIKLYIFIVYAFVLGLFLNSEFLKSSWAAGWLGPFDLLMLIVGLFLIWDHKNSIEIVRATLHDFRIEARGFWFILKTQSVWFSFVAIAYMFLWRVPVAFVLGTIALIIALIAIAVRTFYECIAPQIQSTWVPDPESYIKAVEAYYVKCGTNSHAKIKAAKAAKKAKL